MANAKEIQKRIKSVTSTHKITRTMEMVATSHFMRAVDRLVQARPFARALPEMLALLAEGEAESNPLLASRDDVQRVALLVMTSDRGLCGPLNSNLLKVTSTFLREQEEMGHEVDLHLLGKRGAAFFRFIGQEMVSTFQDLSPRPTPDEGDHFAELLKETFLEGMVDEVYIAYPEFLNAAEQRPRIERLLPLKIEHDDEVESTRNHNFILEPDADTLLDSLLPLFLRNSVFRYLLELAASEHGARRTAMKAATDSAKEMIDSLTLSYNKARQGQITTELLEVVAGAEALK
ncbi:MAG: ATP synthase F1 subunit gamma [bacterium]|nr:ATP synthase F1 subunit gamma [bacterium]